MTLHLFIADDDADDRLLIEDAFSDAGHDTCIALFEGGDTLLTGLQQALQDHELPHLILLDLNMPGRNGLEVLAQLDAWPGLGHIPIVMLTTSDNPVDVERCYQAGASSYLVKPASYQALLELARDLIHYWTQTSLLPGLQQEDA